MLDNKIYYESLTKVEADQLTTLLREKQGNLTKAHLKSGLSIFTLKRAAIGMQAKKETIRIIRTILLNKISSSNLQKVHTK